MSLPREAASGGTTDGSGGASAASAPVDATPTGASIARWFDAHAHLQLLADRLTASAPDSSVPTGSVAPAASAATRAPAARLQALTPQLRTALERAAGAGVSHIAACATSRDDWAQVAAIAAEASVSGVVSADVASTSADDVGPGAPLPVVVPSFGVHPWWSNTVFRSHDTGTGASASRLPLDEACAKLETELTAMLTEHPGAGVGEIGLDFSPKALSSGDFGAGTGAASKEEQQAVFRAQLGVAKALGRVATVHCVKAHAALLDTLRSEGPFPAGVVLHSFSGAAETVTPLASPSLGDVLFSMSAAVMNPRSTKAHKAVATVPAERLLVETDSPDQPPPPGVALPTDAASHGAGDGSGEGAVATGTGAGDAGAGTEAGIGETHARKGTRRVNEPCVVAAVGAAVAELRGETVDSIAAITHANACRVFCPPR